GGWPGAGAAGAAAAPGPRAAATEAAAAAGATATGACGGGPADRTGRGEAAAAAAQNTETRGRRDSGEPANAARQAAENGQRERGRRWGRAGQGRAGRGSGGAAWDSQLRGADASPRLRFSRLESKEREPEDESVGAEDAGPPEGSPEEAPGPSAHALVLGGFGRSRAPKVQPFLPVWLAQPSCVGKNVTEGQVPIEDIPEVHPDLQKKLHAQGISSYFPVQAAVIPALLESTACGFLVSRGGYRPSDLCVSAPTGSGKTLAFVIPVVQALLHRAVCQVRALVVLPTKELAQQVSKVFNVYTDATPLRVALVTGQKSLAKEQESLVQKTPHGFRCLADIVVATPGRLVDHVDQTPGFSLQHLRFLIIDEADRMIDSMHQSWLPRVMAAAFPGEGTKGPLALLQRTQLQAVTAASISCPQMPLQKLLFSATLTQNPEKLQQLGLYQPRLFSTGSAPGGPRDPDVDEDRDSGGKYTFPAGLTHHYIPCSLRLKPLVILHLILEMNFSRVLCFTNSRENSHRLFLLVQAFGGVTVAEFSSRYGPGQRKTILKQFEQGKIQLLISTDATARGIDVQGVQLVLNYDAPQYLRTYVHRVGRTARAGKSGQAFTLLLKVQERRFLRMLEEGGVPGLERHDTPSELLQPLVPRYEAALSQLERAVKEERRQKEA
uniref:ATP-dependent RNA helicase n=1 Tax=Sus scrofa TaxID=9823 RepID=A0A8D0NPU0_PIG